jgi:esterase/lipase superfamily enzyme
MLKNRIEILKLKNWVYERHAFRSEILGQEFHCGLFRRESKTKISKTFYLIHGGGADDAQPVQAGLLPVLADFLQGKAREDVQFIFPFVGNSFLHDHPTNKAKSFSDYFLKELVPSCSEPTSPESRFLCGWSLGGQAALNMFLRSPSFFGGVGVHFPTLVKFDCNDLKQTADYARRLQVSEPMMSVLVSEFQKEFVDSKDFSNHDPLRLAQALGTGALRDKKIYFDVGEKDEFGLFEGASALHDILKQKNIVHQFEIVPQGKHDGPFIHVQISKMLNYLL